MDIKQRLIELIEKSKRNTLSYSESSELYQILNKLTPDSYGKELKHLWETTNGKDNRVNSDKIWKALKEKTIPNTQNRFKLSDYRKSYYYKITAYVAVIALIILSTWIIIENQLLHPDKAVSLSFNEYSVPYGSKSQLSLTDGTKIWLNSGSKIRLNNNYDHDTRTVYLDGEAYFEVATNKKRPFYVITNGINIKVFGTSFNVKAFSDEEIIETTLVSGSVMIEEKDQSGKVIRNYRMKPNQIISYSQKQKSHTLITDKQSNQLHTDKTTSEANVDTQNISNEIEMAIAWKDNRLTFKSETIEDLILKLQRWYNVEITLKNESLKNCRFTGAFDNETIEQAMDALKHTTPFSYTFSENKIIIY